MPTWMVVEDEPDIYDVLLAMFEIWGIEGVAFVDGGEAIAWVDEVDRGNATSELPELAILDIRLPEASGPEVGERLRKSQRLRDTAIVMITAYRLSPSAEEQVIRQAQADALMYKPLPAMHELRARLGAIIAARKEKVAKSVKAEPFKTEVPLDKPAPLPSAPNAGLSSAHKSEPAAKPAAPSNVPFARPVEKADTNAATP